MKKKISLELFFFSKNFLNKIYDLNKHFNVFKKLYESRLASKKRKQRKYYKAKKAYAWYYRAKKAPVQFKSEPKPKRQRRIKRSFTYIRPKRWEIKKNFALYGAATKPKVIRKFIIGKKEGPFKGKKIYLKKNRKYYSAQKKYAPWLLSYSERSIFKRDGGYIKKESTPPFFFFKKKKLSFLKAYRAARRATRFRFWYRRYRRRRRNLFKSFYFKNFKKFLKKRKKRLILRRKRFKLLKNQNAFKRIKSLFNNKKFFNNRIFLRNIKSLFLLQKHLILAEKNRFRIYKFFKVSKSFNYSTAIKFYLKTSKLFSSFLKYKKFFKNFKESFVYKKVFRKTYNVDYDSLNCKNFKFFSKTLGMIPLKISNSLKTSK